MDQLIACIHKFLEVAHSPEFVAHASEFGSRLQHGIVKAYHRNEPDVVKLVEGIVNEVGTFSSNIPKANGVKIETRSVFVHGNRSTVEFKYNGKPTVRELADIIYIATLVFEGTRQLEVVTFNQVKKSKSARWYFGGGDREQLYLLAHFPHFTRKNKNGAFPPGSYSFQNTSGCLGTHGLLYYPGDMFVVSSRILNTLVASKPSVTLDWLVPRVLWLDLQSWPRHPLDMHALVELYCFIGRHRLIPPQCMETLLCNPNATWMRWPHKCATLNVFDFAHAYLNLQVGEMVYAPEPMRANRAVHDLVIALMRRLAAAESKGGKDTWSRLGKQYLNLTYASGQADQPPTDSQTWLEEGGGLGIVWTLIDLGESLAE